ncbi:C3H1-type domain-containing protein [Aphelenchoides bicaudatus]|nr:C3H1-type domain-containing protein [Aphelenchoides bicaudatus]
MGSRQNSGTATQSAPKLPSTTNLIDTLSDQLDYLHVSTQNAATDLLTTNTENHDFGINQTESKCPWSDSKPANNRHSSAKSPTAPLATNNTPTSGTNHQLQSLLTPQIQQPLSPGAVMSPDFYYWNQSYYAGQYQQYPTNAYCPPNAYQWPMTNINFMPNMFIMPGTGPSPHAPNFVGPPPNFQPLPLLKQPFRQDFNRRYGNRTHTQSESGRPRGNGNLQTHRRQGSKTALCRNIIENNTCSFGDRCYFAHSADELKPKPTNSKYKTVNCTAYMENNSCPYGEKCHYIHADDRPPTDPLRR